MTSDCPNLDTPPRGCSLSLTTSLIFAFSPQEITQSLWPDRQQKDTFLLTKHCQTKKHSVIRNDRYKTGYYENGATC